jgi:hypothetical protein
MMRAETLFFVIGTSLVAVGCGFSCENGQIQSVVSPSGTKKIIVFERSCGATTGFNTQVSIIKASKELPGGTGNVLIMSDQVPLKIRWVSDAEVMISGVSGSVFKQESEVGFWEMGLAPWDGSVSIGYE